jgi:beta-fructofuranosidase
VALRLEHNWVWDFWTAYDGTLHHVFFLQAPRSLDSPDARHMRASIGHAVSNDLVEWHVLDDALGPGEEGAWDDGATWTGSVFERDGTWYMFYTGCSTRERGLVQRIGLATSTDLATWVKHPGNPLSGADPRWYEKLDLSVWHDEAWRDPWVFERDGVFHALITARASEGDPPGRGVIGHATSDDLLNWTVQPPLSAPDGFGHLEVPQVTKVGGYWYLLFSCGNGELAPLRRARKGARTGSYAAPAFSPLGPYDLDRARLITPDGLYSARAIDGSGDVSLLAFVNETADGSFGGTLSDPFRPVDGWPV